ncbi:MAG TPA: Uma2 family endonuclease [Gemmatimonadales bacterium]
MPQLNAAWTAAKVRALPTDGQRYEVVNGRLLVTPAPGLLHQRAVLALALLLTEFVTRHRLGEVMISPADIQFSDRDLVQPDIFVVPMVEGRRPREWSEIRTLSLAIEVLSRSTARADRWTKRALYQGAGVTEYWILDLDARVVERWRPSDERPEILSGRIEWKTPQADDPLVIDLEAFFDAVME